MNFEENHVGHWVQPSAYLTLHWRNSGDLADHRYVRACVCARVSGYSVRVQRLPSSKGYKPGTERLHQASEPHFGAQAGLGTERAAVCEWALRLQSQRFMTGQ